MSVYFLLQSIRQRLEPEQLRLAEAQLRVEQSAKRTVFLLQQRRKRFYQRGDLGAIYSGKVYSNTCLGSLGVGTTNRSNIICSRSRHATVAAKYV
jgi:hypothetical protein